MRFAPLRLLLAGLFTLAAGLATAADRDDAAAAAQAILDSLQAQDYEQLWDAQTSAFFKANMSREAFIENVAAGRARLGEPGDSQFMQMTTADADEATGYEGTIYAFIYRNDYAAGAFIERIVVIKDDDGVFRLSGLWGAPVPEMPTPPQ